MYLPVPLSLSFFLSPGSIIDINASVWPFHSLLILLLLPLTAISCCASYPHSITQMALKGGASALQLAQLLPQRWATFLRGSEANE